MYSDFAFPNTFFYFQNLFGTSSLMISLPNFSFLLTFFLLFFILLFLPHSRGYLVILIFSFPSQFQSCVLLAMVFLKLLQSSLGYIYPSSLIPYALCSISCTLSYVSPFLSHYLFHLYF